MSRAPLEVGGHDSRVEPEKPSPVCEGFPETGDDQEVKVDALKTEDKPNSDYGEILEAVANVSERLRTDV